MFLLIATLFISCVGEDIVDDFVTPELRIENPLLSLGINESYTFKAKIP